MESVRAGQSWWVAGTFSVLLLSSCATIPLDHAAPAPAQIAAVTEDDEFSQLIAQLKSDLSRNNSRENARRGNGTPTVESAHARDREFAERARALFAPLTALRMPVVGIMARDLDDSWHAPRDGGSRWHKGIDIFARRGTQVVAVADGIISYIGDQPKGGHCLWLTTESGASFYYAHLDRWAPGIYEGMEVASGDLLGFVGNTGNALTTPPHLHFAVNQNDEMVNPYPILELAVPVQQAHVRVELGGGFGTR
jgi:murein DD-endopeptidase MepM/ murein hydrolase activator NlpD